MFKNCVRVLTLRCMVSTLRVKALQCFVLLQDTRDLFCHSPVSGLQNRLSDLRLNGSIRCIRIFGLLEKLISIPLDTQPSDPHLTNITAIKGF